MGNQPSKTGPQPSNTSPSSGPNDQPVPTRRPLKRKDSIHASPLTKSSPSGPAATLDSATGYAASQSRASDSHSRGRGQTETDPATKSQDKNKDVSNRTSVDSASLKPTFTPNRSVSPRRASNQAPPPITTTFPDSNRPTSPRDPASPSPVPTPYYLPPAEYARPPRLPIPLEDEVLSPGSPIISPADITAAVTSGTDLEGGTIPRRSSVLSATTLDEDDVGEDVPGPLDVPSVDTLIEWKQGGKKVYVTGTFANFWSKKYKLHENGPSKDPKALSAIIPLPIGTHHVTFLVDGQMRTGSHMPTAVDWTNALVNYIEVGSSDPSKAGKAAAAAPKAATSGSPALPPTPELRPTTGTSTAQPIPASNIPSHTQARKQQQSPVTSLGAPTTKKQYLDRRYHTEIPRFLLELDAPEESSRYLRASAATTTLPAPPSLPMFLSKSILNGQTPMKDDSSVLNMPNHTVLNHLATSSIKSGVLATSATTRYKKKYVTTILYKPTSDKDE